VRYVSRSRLWLLAVIMTVSSLTSVTGAGATQVPSVVRDITLSGILWDNAVQTFFFCTTAQCKSQVTTNAKAAELAIQGFQQDLKAAVAAHLASPYGPVITTLNNDVKMLSSTVRQINSMTTRLQDFGIGQMINCATSEMAADIYQLEALSKGKTITFKSWIVGNGGVLTIVQNDLGPLTATSARSSDVAVLKDGLAALAVIGHHLNGPSSTFTAKLATYAAQQATLFRAKIALLSGKHADLTAPVIRKNQKSLLGQLHSLSTLALTLGKA